MSAGPSPRGRLRAVLFDLDGTLIDSAPDLALAANLLRERHGLAAVAPQALRALCGSGARGMLRGAFGMGPGEAGYLALRDAFLAEYATVLLQATRPFDQVGAMLDSLEQAGLPWGIVTNKSTALTQPILHGLGLAPRAAVTVCGDTTAHTKPHPAPLLAAARSLGVAPEACAYVGDDPRDMQAGRAAGMRTVAAAWGYMGVTLPLPQWAADAHAESPLQVLPHLGLA